MYRTLWSDLRNQWRWTQRSMTALVSFKSVCGGRGGAFVSYKLLCPGRKTSPLRTYMLWRLSWHGCKCSPTWGMLSCETLGVRHITTHIDGQSRRRSRQGPRARRKTDGKAKANVTKRTRNDARRATKKQSLFQRDDAGRATRSNLRRLLRSFASATISITDQSADHWPHPTQHHTTRLCWTLFRITRRRLW